MSVNAVPTTEFAPAKIPHFIGGNEVGGNSGRLGDVFNPATGEITGRVCLAARADVEFAIDAAAQAFPAWAAVTPLNRARVLFKFKQLLEQHADEIAASITAEHGKVLSDARGELTRGLEVVEFACGIPHLIKGEHSMNVGGGVDSWSEYAPLAWSPASRRSIFRAWCRCGCFRSPSPAATLLS